MSIISKYHVKMSITINKYVDCLTIIITSVGITSCLHDVITWFRGTLIQLLGLKTEFNCNALWLHGYFK